MERISRYFQGVKKDSGSAVKVLCRLVRRGSWWGLRKLNTLPFTVTAIGTPIRNGLSPWTGSSSWSWCAWGFSSWSTESSLSLNDPQKILFNEPLELIVFWKLPVDCYIISMIDKGKYSAHGTYIKRLPATALAQRQKSKLGTKSSTQPSYILCQLPRLGKQTKSMTSKE